MEYKNQLHSFRVDRKILTDNILFYLPAITDSLAQVSYKHSTYLSYLKANICHAPALSVKLGIPVDGVNVLDDMNL